jgi:hypothetical protein
MQGDDNKLTLKSSVPVWLHENMVSLWQVSGESSAGTLVWGIYLCSPMENPTTESYKTGFLLFDIFKIKHDWNLHNLKFEKE